jgi:predicted ATPase
MKVYFIGCHGSGKSTLCRYVSDSYNLPMIPEVARMVLSEMELQVDTLRSDIKTVNAYQSAVFYRQLEEEKKHKTFVSDRSLIDALAYSVQHSTIAPKLMKDSRLQEYVTGLKQKDTIIFFVRPALATLKNDGVRESVSWDGVVSIDAIIKTLLIMFEINVFQLDTENMQERVQIIDSLLALVL